MLSFHEPVIELELVRKCLPSAASVAGRALPAAAAALGTYPAVAAASVVAVLGIARPPTTVAAEESHRLD